MKRKTKKPAARASAKKKSGAVANFRDIVRARLAESSELLRGHGGRTGRVMRDEEGNAIGRFRGYARAVPELEGIAAPADIVNAITRKRGKLWERIKWETERWAMKHFPQFSTRQRGIVAAPHLGSKRCKACGLAHSATAHRSHGDGAFKRRAQKVKRLSEDFGELRKPEEMPDWVMSNPRGRLIYGEVVQILARRTQRHRCSKKCKAAGHMYVHSFQRSRPSIFGEPGYRGLRIR